MRQIILDTETTGLAVEDGHRVIEIGCLELLNRRLTTQRFHRYLNPEREIDAGALEVHGISRDRLATSPRFAEVVEEFLAFIRGAEIIIHNAAFDVGFLNRELELLGPVWGRLTDYCSVTDSLQLARERHPGQRNSLDALCKRYQVDNTHRTLHGALLDAELLAEVYLAMTGGQGALSLAPQFTSTAGSGERESRQEAILRPPVRVVAVSPEEREAHLERLAVIDKRSGGRCVWLEA